MKFNIPPPGTIIVLTEDQNVPIIWEKRNKRFLQPHREKPTHHPALFDGDKINVRFSKGYTFEIVSIHVGRSRQSIKLKCKEGEFWLPYDTGIDFEIGPILPKKPFFLQNRYQDSGWENLGLEYEELADALADAANCAKDSIRYGMVRVIHRCAHDSSLPGGIILTIPAGGFRND